MGPLALAVGLIFAAPILPAVSFADDATEAAQLVERAQLTFDSFVTDPNMGAFRDLLAQAKGVFVAPQVLKGAFLFGVSGGSGVFIARAAGTDQWAQPAFYTIGEVSFGPQIGGQASEVALLIMTDRGVSAFLENSLKLGVDVGIAVGPVGMGAAAATANLSADIISFSRSKGLYGGLSLNGAVVATRSDWNHAYYGAAVSPSDILIRRMARNPQADRLVAEVSRQAAIRR
jgi:lipid-binding SYLF domain-containing protein